MTGFEYLKKANELYSPRTPRAALLAVEAGLLPEDAYVYLANSVKPLFEEPVDIPEVERILSREDNDLQTNLLLINILEGLLTHKDSEIALFGAESINAIENRYNNRIEKLKAEFKKTENKRSLRKIADHFHELAQLNQSRPAINRFYLAEAYAYMQRLHAEDDLDRSDVEFVVNLLMDMELFEIARTMLLNMKPDVKTEARFVYLLAKVNFYARRYDEVVQEISKLSSHMDQLSDEEQVILNQWTAK
jgi:hypothetical protein